MKKPREAPLPGITLDIKDMRPMACPNCNHISFAQTFRLFEVPMMLRAMTNGMSVVQLQFWKCLSCGSEQMVDQLQPQPLMT